MIEEYATNGKFIAEFYANILLVLTSIFGVSYMIEDTWSTNNSKQNSIEIFCFFERKTLDLHISSTDTLEMHNSNYDTQQILCATPSKDFESIT
jgi:hypothetical protein